LGGGRLYSTGVNRPGREANHSPQYSAGVNEWSYASTSQYVFMEWLLDTHRDNFTFIFVHFPPFVITDLVSTRL